VGLVPYWAKEIKIRFSTINAMAETVDAKEKQPYAIALADRSLMAQAGLWETWEVASQRNDRSFTIITTMPNDLCRELHNRMPVILPPETWSMWLGESEPVEADQLKSLLVPYTGKMVAWPVSQRVGNVKNNDASLIEPIM
jgi:putative SOS response-associated peptidase YedK